MDIDRTFPHGLPEAEARGRIKKLISEKSTKYQDHIKCFEEVWQVDGSCVLKCKVIGISMSGKIEFPAGGVRVITDLPILIKFLIGKVQSELERELRNLLNN